MKSRFEILVALSFFISSCATTKIDQDDDRRVISVVVGKICSNEQPGTFFLSSATAAVSTTFLLNDLNETARQSLIERNKISSKLPNIYTCEKLKYLDEEKANTYFEKSGKGDIYERWAAFYESNPKINGVMYLSLPGYSLQRDVAIVQVVGSCGPTCGNGAFWILRKESEHWRIEKTLQGWQS
jgi:hypothetical protein